jgi:hypothetical protein
MHAKPLSYVGGTMAMQENDETGHTISLDYTFTPTEAFGLYVKQDENGKEILMITPQLNTLLKRWNLPDGQGNIFNMSGAGVQITAATLSLRCGQHFWLIMNHAASFSPTNLVSSTTATSRNRSGNVRAWA